MCFTPLLELWAASERGKLPEPDTITSVSKVPSNKATDTVLQAYISLGRGTAAYVATSCGADLAVVLSILLVTSPGPSGRERVALKGTTGLLGILLSRLETGQMTGMASTEAGFSLSPVAADISQAASEQTMLISFEKRGSTLGWVRASSGHEEISPTATAHKH